MALLIKLHEHKNESYSPKTCKIGNQVWAAENLNDDDGGKGIYHSNGTTYYTWEAAMRIASHIPGWHLPTLRDWNKLFKSVGGIDNAGEQLRATSFDGGLDSYGFSVKPFGYKACRGDSFYGIGEKAHFWTSTPNLGSAYNVYFTPTYKNKANIQSSSVDLGCNIRLIKD